jgi:hypothetical protein
MSYRLIGITRPEITATLQANGGRIGATRLSCVTALGLTAVLAPLAKPTWALFQRQRRLRELVELQRILEALAAIGPLLAARPDTRLDDEAEALELITAEASRLREGLQDYGWARQFQVTVKWDAAAMVAALRQRADVVAALAEAPGRLAAGTALQAIMLGERERLAGEILARLSRVARQWLLMPQDGEDCVSNLVVLIDAEIEPQLDAVLAELDVLLPGNSLIRCVGPLPALSFAALSLDRVDPDRIDTARRLLGVGYRLTPESVRTAWRDYVRTHHPDVAEACAGSSEFAAASAAYHLLRRFADQAERTGNEPALFLEIAGQSDGGRRAA